MKVMFVGSNPEGAATLAFERDINALQRRILSAGGLDISFVFLPSCSVEELPQHLADVQADVLHFAAHGDDDGNLVLANERKDKCMVSAEAIHAWVDPLRPPTLVYLSACNSVGIAQRLAELGYSAIGTTAPITNGAARASAVCFYDRPFRGFTVGQAHDAARAMLTTTNRTDVDAVLCEPHSGQLASRPMVRLPKIIAEPVEQPKSLKSGGTIVKLRIGVMDYPIGTTRVAFFTPDSSFDEGIDSQYTDDWKGNTCWSSDWSVNGDFLIVAAGASPSVRTFADSVMATEALRNCRRFLTANRRSTDSQLNLALGLLVGDRQLPLTPPKDADDLSANPARTRKARALPMTGKRGDTKRTGKVPGDKEPEKRARTSIKLAAKKKPRKIPKKKSTSRKKWKISRKKKSSR